MRPRGQEEAGAWANSPVSLLSSRPVLWQNRDQWWASRSARGVRDKGLRSRAVSVPRSLQPQAGPSSPGALTQSLLMKCASRTAPVQDPPPSHSSPQEACATWVAFTHSDAPVDLRLPPSHHLLSAPMLQQRNEHSESATACPRHTAGFQSRACSSYPRAETGPM